MTIVKWFKRRKERKFIKQTFTTVRCFINECSLYALDELILALQDLLEDYRVEYGVDDIYYHYIGRLEYFKLIRRWRKKQEDSIRRIEE